MVMSSSHRAVVFVSCALGGALGWGLLCSLLLSQRPVSESRLPVLTYAAFSAFTNAFGSGLSTQEVLRVLGRPADVQRWAENHVVVWSYLCGRDLMRALQDDGLVALQVWITNGVAAAWDFMYRLGTRRIWEDRLSISSSGEAAASEGMPLPELMFHVMRGEWAGFGEAEGMPWEHDRWHLHCEAEFSVRTLKRVGTFQDRMWNGQVRDGISLEVDEQAVEALKTFTSRYEGRIIVVTLDGEVIAAPRLAEPITGGDMELALLWNKSAEEVAPRLRRLEVRSGVQGGS